MNFVSIRNAVTSKVGRQALVLQKHSPKLMFAAGVIGIGATVVLACRATLKADEVLEKHLSDAENLRIISETETAQYSNHDYQKDLLVLHARTFGRLAKLYGPSVVVGVASVAALTGAHVVLNRRYAGVTAAYAAIDKAFDSYRQRVSEELGPERERELRLGLVDKEIIEETPEGPVVKNVKGANEKSGSAYTFLFSRETSTSWEPTNHANSTFLKCTEDWANNLLKMRGHVFLNEVLDMLGMEHCPMGAVTGWLRDTKTGDGHIDFGIFRNEVFQSMRFVKGDELNVWLDFNVDGTIWDKI